MGAGRKPERRAGEHRPSRGSRRATGGACWAGAATKAPVVAACGRRSAFARVRGLGRRVVGYAASKSNSVCPVGVACRREGQRVGADAEVAKDLANDGRLGDGRQDAHLLRALRACESVEAEGSMEKQLPIDARRKGEVPGEPPVTWAGR